MKYGRILLKLSGEALSGKQGHGISDECLTFFAEEVESLIKKDFEVGVVIGGGNIHRGVAGATSGMDRTASDHMGMLATVINALALQSALERRGVVTRVLSALTINGVAEPYIRRRAVRHLEKKRVVIFAGGTGNPFFTTDTAAALRANEIKADIFLKATKVDGVYDKDPVTNPDAVKFDQLTYIDVLQKGIKVMDSTAITLCMDNGIKIAVCNIFNKGNVLKIASGEKIGTLITK